MTKRQCPICKLLGVEVFFEKDEGPYCARHNEEAMKNQIENGIKNPKLKNTCTTDYIGHVVEALVMHEFPGAIKHMSCRNPGYDIICGKGLKIDAKGSMLNRNNESWRFYINHNKIADFFVCVGMDDRVSLTPMRAWLFPAEVVNHYGTLGISNSPRGLSRWAEYEKPIDQFVKACNDYREGVSEE